MTDANQSLAAVLVVDDEADMVATYYRLLGRRGHRVLTATTCSQALAVVDSEPLALVVADLRLPDGNGLEVVRAARIKKTAPPVVVVTGYASEASRRQALEAGAAAYLTKPFKLGTFVELVNALLQSRPSASP